jgi:hypothetical protein
MKQRMSNSGENESSGIIRKVFQGRNHHPELPEGLKDNEDGYVLISYGDLSPSMAYLHDPTPGASSHSTPSNSSHEKRSTNKSVRKHPPIIKKSKPTRSGLAWVIRETHISFEEITQRRYPSGTSGAKTKAR